MQFEIFRIDFFSFVVFIRKAIIVWVRNNMEGSHKSL